MNLIKLYPNTPLALYPKTINSNFASIERYLDVIYDGSLGILIRPIETTGKIKGMRGEFSTINTNNLVIKKQFTNLNNNNTIANYDLYKTIVGDPIIPRDACTSSWPYENPSYKVIDVNKPYYKITNEYPVILNSNNLSQIVGIILDVSGTNNFQILLDPCTDKVYIADASSNNKYMEFILINYDPSWGPTWDFYKNG